MNDGEFYTTPVSQAHFEIMITANMTDVQFH